MLAVAVSARASTADPRIEVTWSPRLRTSPWPERPAGVTAVQTGAVPWPEEVGPRVPRVALRALVGSTEASDGRLARVGRIDRRSREVTSRLDTICTLDTLDP